MRLTATLILLMLLPAMAACNSVTKYVIFESGSINQYGGAGGIEKSATVEDDPATPEDESAVPLPPMMGAGAPKSATGAGDAQTGASDSSHFIVISLGQNDGVAQDSTADAAIKAAAVVNSPNSNADGGTDTTTVPME